MNVKYLLTAGFLAIAFVACDNTTSGTSEEDALIGQKGVVTEKNDPSPKSCSSKDKTSSSSTAQSSSSMDQSSSSKTDDVLPDEDEDDLNSSSSTQSRSKETKCTGKLSDDHWLATMYEVDEDIESFGTIEVNIDGTTMNYAIDAEMDLGVAEMCQMFEALSDDVMEDPDEDAEIFGTLTENSISCTGSVLIIKQKRVKKGITESDRKLAYEETIGKCQEYLNGN